MNETLVLPNTYTERESRPFLGKTILVTGGSHGIGRRICIQFAAEGASTVVFISRRSGEERAMGVFHELEELGTEPIWLPIDLSGEDATEETIKMLSFAGIDKIDVLVNNAGISNETLGKQLTPEEEKLLWNTNYFSAYNLTKALARNHLREDSAIINVSSTFGIRPDPLERVNKVYSQTKTRLIEMITMREELGLVHGVRTFAVVPGFVEGDNMASQTPKTFVKLFAEATPGGSLVTEELVAEVITTLAADAKIDRHGNLITGEYIDVDNGLGAKFTEVIMSDEVDREIKKKIEQIARIEAKAADRETRRLQAQAQRSTETSEISK